MISNLKKTIFLNPLKYIEYGIKLKKSPKNLYINFTKIIIIFIILISTFFLLNNTYNEYDNKINNLIFYENNIDFSNHSTTIKAIAIYLPNFYSYNETYYFYYKDNGTLIFRKNNALRIIDKNYKKNYELKLVVEKQIELAKSHGIYGFAIYYYWFSGKTIFDESLNLIYKNEKNFYYLLIWKYEPINYEQNKKILKEEKYEKNISEIIKDIKKYLMDSLYIRINEKPIFGIYNIKAIPNLRENILKIRQKAKEFEIGEIFIISCLYGLNISKIKEMNIFDGVYKLPPKDLIETKIKNTIEKYIYYYSLFYTNIINESNIENFTIFKGSMLEYDNSSINKNREKFGEYSPELFYKINKLLIKNIKEDCDKSNRLIFINAWNNYFEGAYLEPDERYGYGSLNALSKSIFDLPFRSWNYNLSNLMNNCLVAIHAHLFYEDIINEIINKTNNMPVKFDLYLTTDKNKKMEFIKNYTNIYSKANNVIISVLENKGRDILPFLIQIGVVIDKYKYLCHLHSKKTLYVPGLGERWRTYLFNNLLGTSEIISEILSDFENDEKLGLIFPENYHQIVEHTMYLNPKIKERMNYLLEILFHRYKISNKYVEFPAGDMFWARTKAIYQIFKIDLRHNVPTEKGSKNLLFAIERIWLFIVKINGYYYKKYINYYK